MITEIMFSIVIVVVYYLLFPSRVGNTARVAVLDRFILAVRLAVARVALALLPFVGRGRMPATAQQETQQSAMKDILFSSAEDAVKKLVKPKSVIYFSGFAASETPCVWFHALKKHANSNNSTTTLKKGDDRQPSLEFTLISQTASSTRGVGSDALENVVTDTPDGTVKRFIAGHLETCVGLLLREDKKKDLELYNLPLGVISRLVGAQAHRTLTTTAAAAERRPPHQHSSFSSSSSSSSCLSPSTVVTTVGLGTFLDPQQHTWQKYSSANRRRRADGHHDGRDEAREEEEQEGGEGGGGGGGFALGHQLTPSCKLNLIKQVYQESGADEEDGRRLEYSLPQITVAMLHARFADSKGNVYFAENTMLLDSMDAARAAKRNGGVVLVSVQEVRSDAEMNQILKKGKSNNNNNSKKKEYEDWMLKSHEVDAIVVVDCVMLRDFSGLARSCRLHGRSLTAQQREKRRHLQAEYGGGGGGADEDDDYDDGSTTLIGREEACELWEKANLAYGLATTFHRRWRYTMRDAPAITHAHDEVIRWARRLQNLDNSNSNNNNNKGGGGRGGGSTTATPITAPPSPPPPVVRVMIGVSLPELVAMRLTESGVAFVGSSMQDRQRHILSACADDGSAKPDTSDARILAFSRDSAPCIQFLVESGVVGGLPAPGFLFGTSFGPRRMIDGPTFWQMLSERNRQSLSFAHMCVLGAGEVDACGRVNVSRSGSRLQDTIGCGGYPDIVDGVSHAIIIVLNAFSSGTRFARSHGSSIVQEVQQVTFDPLQALRRKVKVRYCTEIGVFHAALCDGGTRTKLVAPDGLELIVQAKCGVKLCFDP